MSNQQEDGFYPRVNASIIASGQHIGMIVSLVGLLQSVSGGVARVKCGDGGEVVIHTDQDFSVPSGSIVEIIGFAAENKSIQHFVTRNMGSDFDLEIYDKMITQVMHSPKFAEYFLSS